jgi:hypothetical protein
VKLNSCRNRDILATGDPTKNNATAEAFIKKTNSRSSGKGANEHTDPSSGDSAGDDITSSLMDASIACGKDGDAEAFHQTGGAQGWRKERGGR